MRLVFLILFLSCSFLGFSADFKAATAPWPPYAYYNKEQQLIGISVDVSKELAQRSGHDFSLSLHHAKRLNKLQNEHEIDINIADSPNWQEPNYEANFVFSLPYLQVTEGLYINNFSTDYETNYGKHCLVGQKYMGKTMVFNQIKDHWNIGLVRGYYYADLESAFQSGQLKKREVSSDSKLLPLLLQGHLDAVIMDTKLFQYQVKSLALNMAQFKLACTLSEVPLAYKLNKQQQFYLDDINQALTNMLEEGLIEEIIKTYTNPIK